MRKRRCRLLILPHPKLYFPTLACSQKHNRIHNIDNVKAAIKVLPAGYGWKTRFASLHLWAPSFEDGQNQPRTPPFQRPAIADWRKEITLTALTTKPRRGRIQYPAMSAFEGASMPYSDQVKENSESMGKEGGEMVKEK